MIDHRQYYKGPPLKVVLAYQMYGAKALLYKKDPL